MKRKSSKSGFFTGELSGSSNVIFAIGLVLLVIAMAFFYLQYNPDPGEIPPAEPIVYAPASSEPEEEPDGQAEGEGEQQQQEEEQPAEPEVDNIPRDEWYMALVNYDNRLSEDFQTDVTDISGFYIDSRAAEDLRALVAASNEAGMPITIRSGSRSWATQMARYNDLVNTYVRDGLGQEEAEDRATRENEHPTTSEHILSLGMDLVPASWPETEAGSENEPAFGWLLEHAHEYGFIQRFPTGRGEVTGVDYEPWHFRYVGHEQAALIYESGLTLEEYLG